MADLIQLRRDTKANWTAANPVLANGELGFETDTKRFKIGNGSTAWNLLEYYGNDVFDALDDTNNEVFKTITYLIVKAGIYAKGVKMFDNKHLRPGDKVAIDSNTWGEGIALYDSEGNKLADAWSSPVNIPEGFAYAANRFGGFTVNKDVYFTRITDSSIWKEFTQVKAIPTTLFLEGNNNTLVTGQSFAVLGGHRYRVRLHNSNPDMSGVTYGSDYLRLKISSKDENGTNLGTLIQIKIGTNLNSYYDFTLPSNAYLIEISMRMSMDVKEKFIIEDLTVAEETQNLVPTTLVEQIVAKSEYINVAVQLFPGDIIKFKLNSETNELLRLYTANSSANDRKTGIVEIIYEERAENFDISFKCTKEAKYVRYYHNGSNTLNAPLIVKRNTANNAIYETAIETSEAFIKPRVLGEKKTIFSSKDFTQGTLYNGRIDTTSQNSISTPDNVFYKLDHGVKYIYNFTDASYGLKMRIAFFDAEFNFISQDGYKSSISFAVPSNAVYIRFALGRIISGTELHPSDIIDNEVILGVGGDSILDYTNEFELIEKIEELKKGNYSESSSIKPSTFVFLWFSDIHGDNIILRRIMDFTNRFAPYFDDVIASGDQVLQKYPDSFDFWNANGADNILMAIGNHEYWKTPPSSGADHPENDPMDDVSVYTKFFAPYIDNWNVIQPEDAATYGYMYFYKDYVKQNTPTLRLVVINAFNFDSTQATWLSDVLDDARINSKHVAIMTHFAPSYIPSHETTFCWYTTEETISRRLSQDCVNIVNSFVSNGGKFACWICGHTHLNGFGVTSEGLAVIEIEAATPGRIAIDARTYGTKAQDAINLICIDTSRNVFKVVRVGKDRDIYNRKIDSLAFSYSRGVLIK